MKGSVPYTYLEVEAINHDYDEQVPYSVIAENVNRDFHEGQLVRSAKSIGYVMSRLNGDDDWVERLEERWLKTIK